MVIAGAAHAAAKPKPPRTTYSIVIKATELAYAGQPVEVKLPAPPKGMQSGALRDERGTPVPCTVESGTAGSAVTLILDLPQGASRRYAFSWSAKPAAKGGPAKGVQLKPLSAHANAAIEVAVDGSPLTTYYAGDAVRNPSPAEDRPKPYCWPIIGPAGERITRAFPMAQVAGESNDHVHHRGLFFDHGDVNGRDFWTESADTGRVVRRALLVVTSGPTMGHLRERNDWIAPDGKKVCEDVRDLRVYRVPAGRLFDLDIVISASEGPVKFGDTKEGTLGLRLADSMSLTRGQGRILNSAGQADRAAWGKRANWVDYSGPVGGHVLGVTIFDDPRNLRHPTYWHVRDYGLFAANPFGIHDFEGLPDDKVGDYTLAKGQTLTFRYRFLIHEGAADAGAVTALFEQYANPPQVTVR
jgi:hypothetical protein